MRKSSTSKPRSMTCKIKIVSMIIDSRVWVWLQIWGSQRLGHLYMMVSLCLGRRTTSLCHQQLHILHQQRRIEYLVWALPLATAKHGGVAPVSYHHRTPIFTILLSLILLVISWSSGLKFWYELVLSFALWSLYVIESVSYIIKISVESRAWLSWYDRGGIKEKKRIKRNKQIILILWRVMTSHIKSMMNKSCWELTYIVLVIVAINRK